MVLLLIIYHQHNILDGFDITCLFIWILLMKKIDRYEDRQLVKRKLEQFFFHFFFFLCIDYSCTCYMPTICTYALCGHRGLLQLKLTFSQLQINQCIFINLYLSTKFCLNHPRHLPFNPQITRSVFYCCQLLVLLLGSDVRVCLSQCLLLSASSDLMMTLSML